MRPISKQAILHPRHAANLMDASNRHLLQRTLLVQLCRPETRRAIQYLMEGAIAISTRMSPTIFLFLVHIFLYACARPYSIFLGSNVPFLSSQANEAGYKEYSYNLPLLLDPPWTRGVSLLWGIYWVFVFDPPWTGRSPCPISIPESGSVRGLVFFWTLFSSVCAHTYVRSVP